MAENIWMEMTQEECGKKHLKFLSPSITCWCACVAVCPWPDWPYKSALRMLKWRCFPSCSYFQAGYTDAARLRATESVLWSFGILSVFPVLWDLLSRVAWFHFVLNLVDASICFPFLPCFIPELFSLVEEDFSCIYLPTSHPAVQLSTILFFLKILYVM